MVVSNTFNFYPDSPTRPLTSESSKHLKAPSYSSADMKKDGVEITEIPLNDIPEKTISRTTTEPIRRSQELARPKRRAKPKPFDRIARSCMDQSLLVKGFLIAIVTCIPFVVFLLISLYAVPKRHYVGDAALQVTLTRLAKWLLVCWGSFIGLLYTGRIVAAAVAFLCTMSTSAHRFRGLARETCMRATLLVWAGVGYAIMPEIFSDHAKATVPKTADDWVNKLRKAFMFLIIAFAIILVQGVLLEMIKIQYIEGYIGPRAEKASNELDVIKDLNNLVNRHINTDDIGIVSKMFTKLFMPVNSSDLYYIISRGEGDEEKWTEYAANIWQHISNGSRKTYLTAYDLSQQLVGMNRDPERGRDLFVQLDESCDGQITEDEVRKLVHKVGLQLNRRTQAMSGIKHLMQKLEIVLSILVLGLILFIYVQFFEQDYAKNIGNLWTGIVGLAFAFSGAVSEFVNSTVFCFGKHPYDIGDFVDIKGKKYIVSRIFLTHTNFEQVHNEHVRGLVVQMSHASLQAEPITNWTRTVEDATHRHSKVDGEEFDRTCRRNDNLEFLVKAKLDHLNLVDGDKTKKE